MHERNLQDVEIEPTLQPLTGESFLSSITSTDPDARADISVQGFWTQGCNAFLTHGYFIPMCKTICLSPSSPSFGIWRMANRTVWKFTANLFQQIMDNGIDLMQSIKLDSKKKATVPSHEAVLKMKDEILYTSWYGDSLHLLFFPLVEAWASRLQWC